METVITQRFDPVDHEYLCRVVNTTDAEEIYNLLTRLNGIKSVVKSGIGMFTFRMPNSNVEGTLKWLMSKGLIEYYKIK